MSKIRCFIGDHKIYEDFDHRTLWRLCEDFTGDFMEDFTNHKTFEDFFVVLYRYIVIFCYI